MPSVEPGRGASLLRLVTKQRTLPLDSAGGACNSTANDTSRKPLATASQAILRRCGCGECGSGPARPAARAAAGWGGIQRGRTGPAGDRPAGRRGRRQRAPVDTGAAEGGGVGVWSGAPGAPWGGGSEARQVPFFCFSISFSTQFRVAGKV